MNKRAVSLNCQCFILSNGKRLAYVIVPRVLCVACAYFRWDFSVFRMIKSDRICLLHWRRMMAHGRIGQICLPCTVVNQISMETHRTFINRRIVCLDRGRDFFKPLEKQVKLMEKKCLATIIINRASMSTLFSFKNHLILPFWNVHELYEHDAQILPLIFK